MKAIILLLACKIPKQRNSSPSIVDMKSLIILVVAASLSSFMPVAESQADEVETAAMLALSKSIHGATALKWTDPDPCNWPLVGCETPNHITRIGIGNHRLQGTLPPDLRNLTNLRRLEAQNNGLSGPLPSLSGLTQLEILLLNSNNFSSIPTDFFNGLSALQAVDLDHNPLSEWTIPDSLKDAQMLVNFSANDANVTGTIPDFLGSSFMSLNHLGLANNSLRGELPKSFAGSSIVSIWVNNQTGEKLSGGVDVIRNLTYLQQAWLDSNAFTGPLPEIPASNSLQELNVNDNLITGIVPQSLINLPSLKTIVLANNLLQGEIPYFPSSVTSDVDAKGTVNRFCLPSPGKCDSRVEALLSIAKNMNYPQKLAEDWQGNDPCNQWLGITCNGGNITVINFQKVGFSGTISPDFQLFTSLQRLLLADNNLTGSIPPEIAKLPHLLELDVRNNLLNGEVPTFNGNVKVETEGNQDIRREIGSPQSPPAASPGSDPTGRNETERSSSSTSLIVGYIVGGVVFGGVGGFLLLGFLGFFFYRGIQQRSGTVQSLNSTTVHPRHSGSDPDTVKVTIAGLSMNSVGSGPSEIQVFEAGSRAISIHVLRNVTNNFSEENILGRGGFATVFKGELEDGTKVAVKRMKSEVMTRRALKDFQSEISVLTKVRHRHLVALLGHCLDGNERLLVYEYMPQGTLSRHLFDWKDEELKPLEWMKRLTIAVDVARGVEYLHNLAHQTFIHRDLKPSNILLGNDMGAKVADFGLVRPIPYGHHSVDTRIAGTFGYLDPEYAVTGRLTAKSDVFSFGVILMELITGRRAVDESQSEDDMHLVSWFQRMRINEETFRKAIDPTIDVTEETIASINTVAELASNCCTREVHRRPDMGQTVNTLSSLVNHWNPTELDLDDIHGVSLEMRQKKWETCSLEMRQKKWETSEDSASDNPDAAHFYTW